MKGQDWQRTAFLQVGGLEQSASEAIEVSPSVKIRGGEPRTKAKERGDCASLNVII